MNSQVALLLDRPRAYPLFFAIHDELFKSRTIIGPSKMQLLAEHSPDSRSDARTANATGRRKKRQGQTYCTL